MGVQPPRPAYCAWCDKTNPDVATCPMIYCPHKRKDDVKEQEHANDNLE